MLVDVNSIPKKCSEEFMTNIFKLVPTIKSHMRDIDHNTRYQVYVYVDDTHFTLVSDPLVKSIRLYQPETINKVYQSMKITKDKEGDLSVSYKSKP
jgi:hypothetical protein